MFWRRASFRLERLEDLFRRNSWPIEQSPAHMPLLRSLTDVRGVAGYRDGAPTGACPDSSGNAIKWTMKCGEGGNAHGMICRACGR